jgi:ABC-type multidrug transport system ATPase subunit
VTPEPSARSEEQTATLELRDANFCGAGRARTAPLSLCSAARRIGLVGPWEPLFQALTGDARISSGSAQIFGCDIERALAHSVVGLAACDPPLPTWCSVSEYLEHAAELSHGARARAKTDARSVLEEYGLAELAALKVGQLLLYQRRALGIALAALTGPPVLCLEAPLRNLDAASADYVARLCAHAAERSRLIISADVPSTANAERALLDACDELFLLEDGALVAHGSAESVLAPSARYLVTLIGAKDSELVAALNAAGCQLGAQPSPTTFSALLAPNSRVTRYLVELPEAASSNLVLDAALDAGLTVLELEPLPRTQHHFTRTL